MTERNQTVLVKKYGSSVLVNPAAMRRVARDLLDESKRGNKVVAIASAMDGETNRLFSALQDISGEVNPHRVAEIVATGEQQSALLLGVAIECIGLDVTVFDTTRLGLVAVGDPLDSDPCDFESSALTDALNNNDVVVAPGFVGLDDHGRQVLLGRGGSDDTALYIANRLGAHCVLVKDVDGVFESDPNSMQQPRRFERINWDDALAVANQLIQPKAIALTKEYKQSFSVAAIEGDRGTLVGPGPSSFY